jgi:predicted  nucleic acid-binding Zn-ribbon protein
MAIALDTLAYARRLREAGFSDEQAEGQAQALAAAMTDTLATKQDLQELETRMDARFAAIKQDLHELEARTDARFSQIGARFSQIDTRFEYLEKHLDTRLAEHAARFGQQLADLERRMTMRLGAVTVAAVGAVSALGRLL